MNRGSGHGRGRGRGRGRGYYPSSSNRGRHSWRNPDDSSFLHFPVQTGASSNGQRMPASLDRNPQRSWRVKQHDSSDVVLENYDSSTPTGRREQVQFGASSDQRVSGSLRRNSHSSWQDRGHNSDGAISRYNKNVTSAGYQDMQQENSTYRDEYSFQGSRVKQCTTSFERVTDDSIPDNQFGSLHIEAKVSMSLDCSFVDSVDHLTDASHLSASASASGVEVTESNEISHDNKNNEHADCISPIKIFDICPPKLNSVITLKPSLLAKNREKRNELKNSIGGPNGIILRSGMVLLKSYLSSSEQANILRMCRNYGLGPAGFYQPLFREGAKLHLKMMCLGEFWDPETSKYVDVRPIDRAKPPSVPPEFLVFVDRAIKDSRSLIAEVSGVKDVEEVLPSVKPDICLVNYYATTGRLGLHQDKDEGRESLGKRIPVVSFSIGDTAEFLYGDERDADLADKILLESGDVLIFGGKSRHIFHGVSTIKPNTAPKCLLEETNFRPGRLNLTFRQHF